MNIEIINWARFNPRKDITSSSWFRMENDIFTKPEFFDFTGEELLAWIYIMSLASKKNSGSLKIQLAHVKAFARIKMSSFDSAIEKLEQNSVLRVTDTGTGGPRNVDVTSRRLTDGRTDGDERTNADVTSDAPLFTEDGIPEQGTGTTFSRNSKEVLEYLNTKAKTAFRGGKDFDTIMQRRFKGGATVEECKRVIDRKARDWLKDPKMRDFLRPSTLFGGKFEEYLGQCGASSFPAPTVAAPTDAQWGVTLPEWEGESLPPHIDDIPKPRPRPDFSKTPAPKENHGT